MSHSKLALWYVADNKLVKLYDAKRFPIPNKQKSQKVMERVARTWGPTRLGSNSRNFRRPAFLAFNRTGDVASARWKKKRESCGSPFVDKLRAEVTIELGWRP
jgi:hypothetical protein